MIGKGGSHASPGYHIRGWKLASTDPCGQRGDGGTTELLVAIRSCLWLAGCRTASALCAQTRGDLGGRAAPGDNRAGRTGRCAMHPADVMRALACQTPAVNYV